MSLPALGYASWKRVRAESIGSDDNAEDEGRAAMRSPEPIAREMSHGESRLLSSSVGSASHREPIRSFIQASARDNAARLDSSQYARSVREDTAELASYFLSHNKDGRSPSFLSRTRSLSSHARPDTAMSHAEAVASDSSVNEPIVELPEPPSPEAEDGPAQEGPSMLTSMLRRSPPEERYLVLPKADQVHEENVIIDDTEDGDDGAEESEDNELTPTLSRMSTYRNHSASAQTENGEGAPLLITTSHGSRNGHGGYGTANGADLESQKRPVTKKWLARQAHAAKGAGCHVGEGIRTICNPRHWDGNALWKNVVRRPLVCLPAVVVGLLLNILDALSYGMILFPLGSPIFAGLGSAGISIFYVSTIISQITFSTGSIFRGGVGSELIEVVPFFHSMAATITDLVGEDNPDAVIATTITSYALSSMLTGTVFYLMGKFQFGYIVGFIPRHILIGCIGGVGWFLVATGFEVSARMDGSLNYDLDTLKRLAQPDTIPLWSIPLVLALILFYGQSKITSKFFLPLYILAIPVAFYLFTLCFGFLQPDTLRDHGWVFTGPPEGESWWYFYTLYKFHLVHWGAIIQCIPAMFALTFFGILHVPINVPALALNTGEDHANLDHELKLHGYSNFLSGMAGSIQNYLVYANSLFFMRSGGDSRLAGFELAALTFVVMTLGPGLIGYIPVMMVGVLIFDLGFELLLEAVWHPRKKLKLLEYLTVVAIVLIMGIYDFVVGIGVGILLAFVSLVFQAARVPAVRATYSGDVVGSTVRRNPTQQHFLRLAGRQTSIIKLSGYLFFGTIVSVEDKIRALIADDEFARRPIKFLIIDLWLATGIDYSAGEVFNTISRLLDGKGVELIISGVDTDQAMGRSLRAVGLGEDVEVKLMPNLNSALEYCENELLKTLYASQEQERATEMAGPTANLDVPGQQRSLAPMDALVSTSPRRVHLREAAQASLGHIEGARRTSRWQSFREPLRLMLQIFEEISDKNEDFWFRAVSCFKRRECKAGTVLFRRGDEAEGFYLVESGILRAEYSMPQGWLMESIVAGTTCGELPFFSDTPRTATVVVERDCVIWQMDRAGWESLQKDHEEVARELLRLALKLTSERMSTITGYALTMAG